MLKCLKHVLKESWLTIKYKFKLSIYLLICKMKLSDLWCHWYSLWTSCYARIFTFRVCWFCMFWHHWWCCRRWVILYPWSHITSDLFTVSAVMRSQLMVKCEVFTAHQSPPILLLLLRHVTLSLLLSTLRKITPCHRATG